MSDPLNGAENYRSHRSRRIPVSMTRDMVVLPILIHWPLVLADDAARPLENKKRSL